MTDEKTGGEATKGQDAKKKADSNEKARNDAAKRAAGYSVIGGDGTTPAQRSGLGGVPNSVLNPAYVIVEEPDQD